MRTTLEALCAVIGAIFCGFSLICGLVGAGLLWDVLSPAKDDPFVGFILFGLGLAATLFTFFSEVDE